MKDLIKMNLQLFADGEASDAGTETTGTTETTETTETVEVKSFTQAELDAQVQAEADRRVSKALETAKAKWAAEEAEKVEQAKELAKLSEQERAARELQIEREAINKERQAIEFEKLNMQTKADLIDKNLPVDFSVWLVSGTIEKTTENINTFETAWKAAIDKGLDERIGASAGTPPGSGTPTPTISTGAQYAQRYNVNVVPQSK